MSSLGAQTAKQIPLTLKNDAKVYSVQLQGVCSKRNYERNADNSAVQIIVQLISKRGVIFCGWHNNYSL
jgi:hypothetical protein